MDTAQLSPAPTSSEAPSVAAAPRRRLLGDLLIREGLVSRQHLDDALRAQADAEEPRPLGEILVESRVITRSALDFVLEKYHKKYRLGDILVETNAITEAQLETALDHQKRTGLKLGDALLELKVLTERQMKEALCKQVRATFVDLDATIIERRLTELIPRDYAEQRRVLPVSQSGDRLTLAMEDPADVEVVEELEQATGCRIDVVTSTHAAFERAFRLYDESPPADPPPSAGAQQAAALAALQAERDALRRQGDEAAQGLRQLEQRHAQALRAIRELEARQAETTRRLEQLQAAHAELSEANFAATRALHEQRRQYEALLRQGGQKREDDFDVVLRQLSPSPRRRPPRPR